MNSSCSLGSFRNQNESSCAWHFPAQTVKIEELVPTPAENFTDFVPSPTLSSICLPDAHNELIAIPPSCFNAAVTNESFSDSPTGESSSEESMALQCHQGLRNSTVIHDKQNKCITYVFDFAQQPFIGRTDAIWELNQQHQQDRHSIKEDDVEMIAIDEIFKETGPVKYERTEPNEHHMNCILSIFNSDMELEKEKQKLYFTKSTPHKSPYYTRADSVDRSHLGSRSNSASRLWLRLAGEKEVILENDALGAVVGNTRQCKRLCQSEVSTVRWWSFGSRVWGSREDGGVYINGVLHDFMEGNDVKTNKSELKDVADKNKPSRFCHICLRKAERVTVVACGNIFSGQCRKVVCRRCFKEQGWDWDTAITKGSGWVCPHCRNM